MRTSILALMAIVAAALFSGSLLAGDAHAQGKNLKILPKTMTKAEIKKTMKSISTALGVQCDHCHNTDDMALDTDKKKVAREMMTMTGDLNKKFFKSKMRVTCMTCHNGKAEPKK